jgi:signal transduction histidine kinase
LQTIREEERTHIAREIHDELGQALTGMKMDLFWLKEKLDQSHPAEITPTASDKLASLIKETDLTIDTVRRISTDLRPSILDTLGLAPAIEWLANDFQARSGISCGFKTNLEQTAFTQDFSTMVFRICQAALTNIARHAQASQVHIHLIMKKGSVRLKVQDNGRGITEEETNRPGSLGILGMQERAYAFQGTVEYIRPAGGGTCVVAQFPSATAIQTATEQQGG